MADLACSISPMSGLVCMCDRMHGAGSAASPKAQLDWSCAYKAKAGILQNEDVWANAANMGLEAWFEMYLMPLHPELAIVGMRALSQLISASSCERNEDPQQDRP